MGMKPPSAAPLTFNPNDPPKLGDFLIWWVPNPPRPGFQRRVPNVETAAAALEHLAAYDIVCRPETGLITVGTRLKFMDNIKEPLIREIIVEYDRYLDNESIYNIDVNAGGLQSYVQAGDELEWEDWYDEKTQEDIDHFLLNYRSANPMTIESATHHLDSWRQQHAT